MAEDNKARIITIKELLNTKNLSIPVYQRPYKWTTKNVNQLIDDILMHKNKTAYRLGTVVMHQNEVEGKLDIVDGQQRTITLFLIAHALLKRFPNLKGLQEIQVPSWSFNSNITHLNIMTNYNEVCRRITDFSENDYYFFVNQCEVVQIILTDISEAFQFFDSQNSRGKDLEPHDLLKAYHLREMEGITSEVEKMKCVEAWEAMSTDDLSILFGQYLYRIRNWSKGKSARYFTKNEVDVFKGINPDSESRLPHAQIYRIAHHFTEKYNGSFERKIDGQIGSYPFQIDQVIVNGKRFFEMIGYYKLLVEKGSNLKGNESDAWLDLHSDSQAIGILQTISNYEGRLRSGDKYVRNLFDCCLLYYIDKFGTTDVDKAIEKTFIWAYILRLRMHSVYIASVDNYVLNEQPWIFKCLREAIRPADFTKISLKNLEEVRSTNTTLISDLFKEMKYYNEPSKRT